MLDIILKHAFEILQTTDDNREKLQAMGTQGYSFVNLSYCQMLQQLIAL